MSNLMKCNEAIELQEEHIEKFKTQRKALMQLLLTGIVRV